MKILAVLQRPKAFRSGKILRNLLFRWLFLRSLHFIFIQQKQSDK